MASNFTPSDAADENISGLTSELAVQKYLESTPFSSQQVIRLRGGTTNYTFRLHLRTPYGEGSPRKTAILKYATPFVASAPLVPFSVDRQRYEARALTELPKSTLLSGGRAANLHGAKVRLPGIYLEDVENNVLIIEDVAPPADVEPKRITCTLLIFLTGRSSVLIQIPSPVQIAEQAGVLLGDFLAQLHCWGKAEQNIHLVKSLFRDNTPARETCVRTTFRDFLPTVEGRGISLTTDDRDDVLFEMEELEREVFHNPETLTMGDFWRVYSELTCALRYKADRLKRPGNIIIDFRLDGSLCALYIIDWEFASSAPAFTDVGHFCAEIFIDVFSAAEDEVPQRLLTAFLGNYIKSVDSVNIPGVVAYTGAHLGSFVGKGSWGDPAKRKTISLQAIDMIKNARNKEWKSLQGGALARLFQ